MKIYKYFLLLIAILLTSAITKAQDSTRVIKFNQTNVGIPIKKSDFDKKISNYIKLMSDWTTFKPDEYIDMVRAYNTIGGSLPINNDFYKTYYTVFLVMYSKLAAKSLDAKLSKGMAMYSEKYKLWIGDVPLGNDNSRFKIDTTK